jgi:multiple sugar transport system substrate-binding protein
MQSNTFDGKAWGVPWYTDGGLLYYRQDKLEKAGYNDPPKTWEELIEQAQKVQQDEGIKFGFVFQGAEYEGGVCNGCEYIWTHGGNVLDPEDPSKVIIDSPEAAGLATWRSTIEDGPPRGAYSSIRRRSRLPHSPTATRFFCATGPTCTP